MDIAGKIKQLRTRANLTQEQLSDRLGVTPQSVSKWENAVAMPDITMLPALAEQFGVSIDELFDLTVEQKMKRIENRMELEEELPKDVFEDYEEFLKSQLETHKARATALLAHLYAHNMRAYAKKTDKYAREAIRLSPEQKDCQWLLTMAAGQVCWDWNFGNHTGIIDFYKEVIAADAAEPKTPLPYYYLIDNLLADHRADEAESYLSVFATLPRHNPMMVYVYRAHIALARYDEAAADAIIEEMLRRYPADSGALFEAAQYYAKKCRYDEAIRYYEQSYECETSRPRYTDAPMAISEIYEIMGDYVKATEYYDKVIENMREEWGLREEVELRDAIAIRDRLAAKIKR